LMEGSRLTNNGHGCVIKTASHSRRSKSRLQICKGRHLIFLQPPAIFHWTFLFSRLTERLVVSMRWVGMCCEKRSFTLMRTEAYLRSVRIHHLDFRITPAVFHRTSQLSCLKGRLIVSIRLAGMCERIQLYSPARMKVMSCICWLIRSLSANSPPFPVFLKGGTCDSRLFAI